MEIDNKQIYDLWNMIYNISIGMLHNSAEAEDAVQEIFEKILVSYSKFKNESKLETWAYRIAKNHLINIKKSFKHEITFEQMEYEAESYSLHQGELGLSKTEEEIYIEEVKVGCTLAILQCLDSETRMLFIFGNVFGFENKLGAEIFEIKEDLYRKKLSRANIKVRSFMNKNCGLINPEARCKCRRRLKVALDKGRIDPERIMYKTENKKISAYISVLNEIDEIAKVYQNNPFFEKRDLFNQYLEKISI